MLTHSHPAHSLSLPFLHLPIENEILHVVNLDRSLYLSLSLFLPPSLCLSLPLPCSLYIIFRSVISFTFTSLFSINRDYYSKYMVNVGGATMATFKYDPTHGLIALGYNGLLIDANDAALKVIESKLQCKWAEESGFCQPPPHPVLHTIAYTTFQCKVISISPKMFNFSGFAVFHVSLSVSYSKWLILIHVIYTEATIPHSPHSRTHSHHTAQTNSLHWTC